MSTYTMLIEKGKKEGEQIGMQKGEQIGIQKGKLEGEQKVTTEFVLNLFNQGFDTASIARLVKLPEEEVINILKDNGRLEG